MSLTKARISRSCSGLSLAEYMVSIGIGALILLILLPLTLYTGRSFAALVNYIDLNSASVLTLDTMTRDVRQSVNLVDFSSNRLTFSYGSNAPAVIYDYSPTDRTLVREENGVRKVLLNECDSLQFFIYQRTPLAGTYDQYPAASATNCKVVSVKWTCSRTILGAKLTTDSEQEGKIVIRKH